MTPFWTHYVGVLDLKTWVLWLLLLAFFLVLVVRSRKRAPTYLFAIVAAFITIAMVVRADVAFQAAVKGLKIWWDIVFPALLPFFVGSEILMGLGVVHFMGVLLEPFMRPLFNVPGVGSFVMAMGLASGYPLGAILTANLRRKKLCSKTEAERLMSFCNTADPLFMTGAVAVGMFGVASLGAVICGAHYLSAIAIGLVMAFYRRKSTDRTPGIESPGGNILVRALNAMVKARDEDDRPFGTLMGDAIRQSVNSLLLIGGFIILFSSIIAMLGTAGVTSGIASVLTFALKPLGVDPGTISSMVSGLFEISLGTQMASQAPVSLAQKLMAVGAIIAWSGISVHMQVAAMVQGTDITMGPYICARVGQAVLAALFTLLLTGPGSRVAALISVPALSAYEHASMGWLAKAGLATSIFLKVSGLAVLGGLLLATTFVSRRNPR